MSKPRIHVTYRLYGTDSSLLYVGFTSNVPERFKDHRASKSWWREVARARLQVHQSRATAKEAEIEAIRTERPRYNVCHRAPGTPRPVMPSGGLMPSRRKRKSST